jgi:hypothetical protein
VKLNIPELSDADITRLSDEVDNTGFGVLTDFVSHDDVARMQNFVINAIDKANGEYVGFTGSAAVAGSGLEELAASASFRRLIERLYATGTGRTPPKQEFYQVLRCLSGQSAQIHSRVFHYDSYVVTVLIPIKIPTKGQTGDFLMLPNTRSIRNKYIWNAMDKVLLDNRVTQWILRRMANKRSNKIVRIKMVPGNAYFFWGYRSIHTNEPCDPNEIRATALFHYANPHDRKPARAINQLQAA